MCNISKIEMLRESPVPLYRKKNFSSKAFADELDQKLSKLVSRFFPLNFNNFENIFDQFVNIIAKTIGKHAPLGRMRRKHKKLSKKLGLPNVV